MWRVNRGSISVDRVSGLTGCVRFRGWVCACCCLVPGDVLLSLRLKLTAPTPVTGRVESLTVSHGAVHLNIRFRLYRQVRDVAAKILPLTQQKYVRLRREGWGMSAAARECGVSRTWAYKFETGVSDSGQERKKARELQKIPGPISRGELCADALRGLEDFEFFRLFYLGHVSTPWQIEAAYRLVELLATADKEFIELNCPPGVGKTTLVHDVACWITARDRRVRGLIGSKTEVNARRMLQRIRRSLERPTPFRAPSEAIEKGYAADAQAALSQHYGAFKPVTDKDVWRAEEFIVAQFDDIPIEEKEPTWSAYGMDSGVLSNRFNVIVWDDLVDRQVCRTVDSRKNLVDKWDEEFETRLEPGGVLMDIGQRMHPEDLHATLRDRRITDEDDQDAGPMYHHIAYPAHDTSKCMEVHKAGEAKPWPDGCLLDPFRLPWRDCKKLMQKKQTWAVVYQQTDGDPTDQFVHPLWISGGQDGDGIDYPGCWDHDRPMGKVPVMEGRWISVATSDPSPTKMWATQWWIYHPGSELRFLIDMERKAMEAPDFFDYNPTTRQYSGLMVDWQERSEKLGFPISHWIVERNAAQRFLLKQTTMQQFTSRHSIHLIPHETTMNKADELLGVQSIRDHYRYGRVRLPGARSPLRGRTQSMQLVDELVRWPEGSTDDCVMAHWFLEWNLPKLVTVPRELQPKLPRPTWYNRLVGNA